MERLSWQLLCITHSGGYGKPPSALNLSLNLKKRG
jgi:hypothetical protein